MVFLNDSKSLQVSWTLFDILTDLNDAVVWMFSARPSNSSSPFNKPLGIVSFSNKKNYYWRQFANKIRVRWANCHHFKLLISHMPFVGFRFCQLCSKLVSVGHCLWAKQYHETIHFASNGVLNCSHSRQSFNTKISKCLTVNLRTV